jgi:hypothetical protein
MVNGDKMSKKNPLKPGNITPASGQYGIVNKKGKKTKTEITGVEGKPLPPTPKPGMTYVLNDKTVHDNDKKP